MKKFKERFLAVLTALTLVDKAKNQELTQEDWDSIAASYKETHGSDFYSDQKEFEQVSKKASAHDAALALLGKENSASEKGGEGSAQGSESAEETPADLETQVTTLRDSNKSLAEEKSRLEKENKEKEEKIKKLSKETEDDNPKTEIMKIGLNGMGHTDKHVMGIEHPLYSLDNRWNQVMANPAVATLKPADESSDGEKFRTAVKEYSSNLAARYQYLQSNGLLDPKKLSTGELDVTHTGLADAGLGEQFVVRRQDALIARILNLPTVHDIFPRRFGIQDRELITNAFFGEFSQAYQSGEVWKGEVELQPEMGHVDDSMMKTLFNSLKWIERQYIGYLNRDGSDPVKWNMIEWMVLNIATVLTNEQFKRRIQGFYIKPTAGTAGHTLHASSGFIYTLIRYQHENKLLPFADAAYATYSDTASSMISAVEAFIADVKEKAESLDGYELLLNKNHEDWFRRSVRNKYGKDFDFGGPKTDKVPDTDIPIRWVPNMSQMKFMVFQQPGNMQCLENLPGEMYAIKFQQDMEAVKSWAVWKEGFSASHVGKKFDSLALLTANDYKDQVIFVNKPVTSLAADATTCDGTANFWFKTIANTVPTAITDITGAEAGKVYIIECGNLTDATTIAKAGKFSELTAAWTPTAVGDYLMVYYDTATSKFHDLERCVGGTRSVVTAKQPHIPAA